MISGNSKQLVAPGVGQAHPAALFSVHCEKAGSTVISDAVMITTNNLVGMLMTVN